jgi:hypothetical protein
MRLDPAPGSRRGGAPAGLAAAALLAALAFGPAGAAAEPEPAPQHRFSVVEENDSLPFHSDKHYTQGLRFSYLGPPVEDGSAWGAPFDAAAAILPWMEAPATTRTRRYAILVGQSLFTPKDTDLRPPDRGDRPYAGWLYGGVSLLEETDRRVLDHFELQLGLVGPGALGKSAQNEWHQFIGVTEAEGWGSQIQNEVGLVLEVERKWRLRLLDAGPVGLDVVPELGAVAGNVFTYGKTGAVLRIGSHLDADYGPARITPALSGTDYVDATALPEYFGFYAFVGAEGRAVARNLFLDGNTFRGSRSVDKKALVGDLQAGVSLFWSNALRLDVMAMRRSPEFEGQGAPDILGTVGLSVFW